MKRRDFVGSVATLPFISIAGCKDSSQNTTEEPISTPIVDGIEQAPDIIDVAFNHGVASGDPQADRVILWTRVSPALSGPQAPASIPVTLMVSRTPEMTDPTIINTIALAERDYTVKVDASGLDPDTWYYFSFGAGNVVSPVGRTRTFPAKTQRIERARFATVSCANYAYGHFSAYQALADVNRWDLDFVLHLGDYLYEYAPGTYDDPSVPNRSHEPANEIVSLSDYRIRHAQYKTDTHLQAIHQQYPMICIWDDHESTNDSYKDGAENHQPESEGDWPSRKARAIQAYMEWMPVREKPEDPESIWRSFQYGDLIDLWMLDTRLEGRDQQVSSPVGLDNNAPDRKLISDQQMNWWLDGMTQSQSVWRMIGQQVMFAQLNIAELPTPDALSEILPFGTLQQGLNMDQWDGYTASRNRVLSHIEENNIDNVIVFTGDIHTSWANEIYRNPATLIGDLTDEALAVEFVTPSVTSPGFPEGTSPAVSTAISIANPHIKYSELETRGFVVTDVTRQRTQAEYYYVTSIADPSRAGDLDNSKTKLVKVDAKQNGKRYRLQEDNLTPTRARIAQTNFRAPEARAENQQSLANTWAQVHRRETTV